MMKWSYSVLDSQDVLLGLKGILTSSSPVLRLVRTRTVDKAVVSRTIATFDAADYDGDEKVRNVECFQMAVRLVGHDGAVRTAQSLMTILDGLRQLAPVDPAGTLASLQEGDLNHILSGMSRQLAPSRAIAPH